MKKICMAVILLTGYSASAQTSGIITYNEVVKLKLDMEMDSSMAAMMAMMPKETKIKKELIFNADASLYQSGKEDPVAPDKNIDGENRIVIRMDAPDEKIFCDFANNKIVEQKDFMSRKFLIDTTMTKMEWKLTGKQKMILNYPCQQAMQIEKGDTIIAWFTPAIHLPSGPVGFRNLPGMILETSFMHGEVTITAANVELKEIDKVRLVAPAEGKKTTRTKFRKTVEEKRKEMQEQNGGKGNMVIKIEKH